MLNKRHRRVFGYARVSSEEQARGTSLQDQDSALNAGAKTFGFADGIPIENMFVEAESAIHEKFELREKIQRLMGLLQEGDLLLVALVDRWSRDPEFTYASMRQLGARRVDVYFIIDRCDPSTPDGDTYLGFRILFAREEHKRIKLRMVGTRKRLLDRGYFAEGQAPLGYRRALAKGIKGAEKNILVPIPEQVEIVRNAFLSCCTGKSTRQIGAALHMTRTRALYVLRNRTYLGEVRDSNGNWIPGKHEPIVDADVFARAQAALESRRATGSRPRESGVFLNSDWILRDVARCARCGAVMGTAYGALRRALHSDGDPRICYYRCAHRSSAGAHRCSSGNVAVRAIEALAAPMVLDRMVELREEIARGPGLKTAEPTVDYSAQLEKISARRGRIVDLFSEGLISRDELRSRLAKVDEQMLRVKAARDSAARPDPMSDETVRRSLLGQIDVLTTAWERADGIRRRRLVSVLAKEFRIERGQPPVPVWRTPAELMEAISR